MTADVIIRGGVLVEAAWQAPTDILIENGRVIKLSEPGTLVPGDIGANTRILDASDRLILPGGVDPHCHVGFTSGEFTSLDDYRQCTTAAVFGGTTTIVDFAIPRPGEAPIEVARNQREKASQGICDSALHASVVDWDDSIPDQLGRLTSEGIVTVKMFTTYRGETMAEPDTILRTMRTLRDLGGMVIIHCEANAIIEEDQRTSAFRGQIDAGNMRVTRSQLAETAAVAEVLALAESVDAPVYFVHQSTREAVDLVNEARRRGIRAYTESVAHHLVLDETHYLGDHPERFVCCPPLRDRKTVEALGAYVFNGLIATIGSDHCCYDTAQKEKYPHDVRAMPNGLPGVETRLSVTFSEYVSKRKLSPSRFVEMTSTNPARLNGIHPRKGTLMPGADADAVLWDPQERWTIRSRDLHMATDYTPYEGMEIVGKPKDVLVRGEIVVQDGQLVNDTARGQHIPANAVDFTVT